MNKATILTTITLSFCIIYTIFVSSALQSNVEQERYIDKLRFERIDLYLDSINK